MLKNLVNRIADNFDREEFGVAPQKKLKTISRTSKPPMGSSSFSIRARRLPKVI